MSGSMWPVPPSPSEMHYNREEATTARQSAELASQRSYQIRAQDMAAAGLNPILAAQQGGGRPPPAQAHASVKAGQGGFDPSVFASARLTNAKAVTAEVEAQIAKENYAASKKAPGGFLETLPPAISGPAAAVANALREGVVPGVVDAVEAGVNAVRTLGEKAAGAAAAIPRGVDRVKRYLQEKRPSTAVEAQRQRGASVLPGGAIVGRRIPGQLDRLRLKRADRE